MSSDFGSYWYEWVQFALEEDINFEEVGVECYDWIVPPPQIHMSKP